MGGAETLEHVHETSKWFAGLIKNFEPRSESAPSKAAHKICLRSEETWNSEPTQAENRAEATVRAFQSAIFQSDAQVAENAGRICSGERIKSIYVPGGHFAMLHAPHVTTTALQLC